jgi:hypothetical protein
MFYAPGNPLFAGSPAAVACSSECKWLIPYQEKRHQRSLPAAAEKAGRDVY